jgi:hypothetical protein
MKLRFPPRLDISHDCVCMHCEIPFIPYAENITCPKCGAETQTERHELIDYLVKLLEFNKKQNKTFLAIKNSPQGSLIYDAIRIICGLFDEMETKKIRMKKKYITEWYTKSSLFDGQDYLRGHFCGLTILVLNKYRWRCKNCY